MAIWQPVAFGILWRWWPQWFLVSLGPGIPAPRRTPTPENAERHRLPYGHVIRSRAVLGGLHYEYWLEKRAAWQPERIIVDDTGQRCLTTQGWPARSVRTGRNSGPARGARTQRSDSTRAAGRSGIQPPG